MPLDSSSPPNGHDSPILRAPRAWEGFLLVGICLVLFVVLAGLWHGRGLAFRFLFLPALAFLAPSLLWVLWRGGLRQAFPAHEVGRRGATVALLFVIGGSLLALGLAGFISLLPGAQKDEPTIRALLVSVDPLRRLLFFALVPALCEESLFRGALLWCLRPWGTVAASLASALAFALVHASPYRFLPVAVLGWVLALVVIKAGNFWLAVAGHALHNSAVLWAWSSGSGRDGGHLLIFGGGDTIGVCFYRIGFQTVQERFRLRAVRQRMGMTSVPCRLPGSDGPRGIRSPS